MNNFSKLGATAGKVNSYFHDCRERGHNGETEQCRICQESNTGNLTQKNIGQMIQRHLIEPFYSQNKPSKEKVEVLFHWIGRVKRNGIKLAELFGRT